MRKLIFLTTVLFCCLKIYSQQGKLDSSFRKNGIVMTDFGTAAKHSFATTSAPVTITVRREMQ